MKTRTKLLIIAFGLLLLCLGCGLWYLQTESFQKLARGKIISEIEKATGLECRVQTIRLKPYRGKIEIEGLELIPRTAAPGLVTLKVNAIRAILSVSSFWHFHLRLRELNIIGPQVEFISGGGDSGWNPEAFLKNLQISLKLEAGKFAVQEGWFKINDREAPFNLSLVDLDLEIRYARELPSYKIDLEYKQSRIFFEQREIVHDLGLIANLSLEGVELEHIRFHRGKTLLIGNGSIRNWKSPVLLLHVAGMLDAEDLQLADSSLYEGRGEIGVVADLRSDAEGIYSKGHFSLKTGAYRKMSLHDLSGEYEILHEVLSLRNVSGGIARGNIHVEGEIQLRSANKAINRVAIQAKDVPLIEVGRLLNLPLLGYENTADSQTVLTWGGDRGLKAECDAALHGLDRPANKAGKSTLLAGGVRFTYFENGEVRIASANLSSSYTTVQAYGGQGALFHIRLSTSRFSEPLSLIAGFSPSVADLIRRQPDVLGIAGRYDFNGDVRIKSSTDVTYEGSVSVKDGRWRSYVVDTLSAQARFSPPRLTLQPLSIHHGAQTLRGNLELEILELQLLEE